MERDSRHVFELVEKASVDVDPSLPNYFDPTHIALDIARKADRSSWGWMLRLSSYRLVRIEVLE